MDTPKVRKGRGHSRERVGIKKLEAEASIPIETRAPVLETMKRR